MSGGAVDGVDLNIRGAGHFVRLPIQMFELISESQCLTCLGGDRSDGSLGVNLAKFVGKVKHIYIK